MYVSGKLSRIVVWLLMEKIPLVVSLRIAMLPPHIGADGFVVQVPHLSS
jgi:hypothetical protein